PGMTVREALAVERELQARLEAKRQAERKEELRRAEARARAMVLVIPADPATWETELLPTIIATKSERLVADVQAYLRKVQVGEAPSGISVCEAVWRQFDANKQAELEDETKRDMQLYWEIREEVLAESTCLRPDSLAKSEKAQ